MTAGGEEVERPDLVAELLAGRDHLLCGMSGQGKTLWAAGTAVELARAGHPPIWLPIRAYGDGFATFLARAVAPYTTLPAAQVIAAARAAGRHVVLVVDGLNEVAEAARGELLAGVQALKLHAPSHAVLATTQQPQRPGVLPARMLDLRPLHDDERRAILAAQGADALLHDLDGFQTPLDLSLAAACAADLGHPDGPAELLDGYVDRLTGDETTRTVLRSLAWRMHQELRLSLRAPDAARCVRRDLGLDTDSVVRALSCRLLRVEHGRVSFIHERFASFLGAEALLERCPDGAAAARALNEPRAASIRRDAIGLERDEVRLGALLAGLEDEQCLLAAASGQMGLLAQRMVTATLADALRLATARTTPANLRFAVSDAGPGLDSWEVPWSHTAADRALLATAGRCLRRGVLVDEAARLVEQTDTLCVKVEAIRGLSAGWTFMTTYASGRPTGEDSLPATVLVRACAEHWHDQDADGRPAQVARQLVARAEDPGLGILCLALSLLQRPTDDDVDVLVDILPRALRASPYHLRLEALELAELGGRWLPAAAQDTVLEAVQAIGTDDLFLGSAVVEALAALGGIEPTTTVDDLLAQLRVTLSRPDDPLHCRLAAGSISSQFEEQDVVGPWYAAIEALAEDERALLFAMALRGCQADEIHVGWLLEQLDGLEEPRLRTAMLDFVGRIDPHAWHSKQWGTASTIRAVKLIAEAGLPRPTTQAAEQRSAWECFLDVLYALFAADDDASKRHAGELLDEHEEVVADLLAHLGSARIAMVDGDDHLEAALVDALGSGLVAALIRSLEHPERLRSPFRFIWEDDRARRTVETLGRIGNGRTADVLRRFADDRSVGPAAVAAVREIEARR